MEKNSGWVVGDAPGHSISMGSGWSKGSSSSLCCVCQLQHLSRMGSSAVEGRRTLSSDQLSPVSHSYLRNVYLVSSWLFPGVSTKLEPNRLRVCKRILPSGRLQLAHPLGTEGAWSSCAANLWVWELRHGQLQEEQPWNGTNTIE